MNIDFRRNITPNPPAPPLSVQGRLETKREQVKNLEENLDNRGRGFFRDGWQVIGRAVRSDCTRDFTSGTNAV